MLSAGFLSTGDLVLPGNWGLKDIIFSLKWLQENISSFGGDKNAVTILGNSKGGAAVQLLLYNEPAVNAGMSLSRYHRKTALKIITSENQRRNSRSSKNKYRVLSSEYLLNNLNSS